MGRVFQVYYDDNKDRPFYVCGSCNTEVARVKDILIDGRLDEEPIFYFRSTNNLVVDDERYYRTEGDQVVADVSCVRCLKPLGLKIVRLVPGVSSVYYDGVLVPVGTIVLHLLKVLKWNGTNYVAAEQMWS